MDKFNVEHLDLYYGDFKALKDINLKLPANEITAFIGPSVEAQYHLNTEGRTETVTETRNVRVGEPAKHRYAARQIKKMIQKSK